MNRGVKWRIRGVDRFKNAVKSRVSEVFSQVPYYLLRLPDNALRIVANPHKNSVF